MLRRGGGNLDLATVAMTDWTCIARRTIADLKLPEDMPLVARMKAVNAAYPFGERERWPYKAWLKARREYLGRFGYRPPPKSEEQTLFDALPRDPMTGRPVIG